MRPETVARTPSDPLRPVLRHPPPFHDHSHDDADNLSKTFGASRMLLAEELIQGLERFELADDARQGGAIVMDFRLLHAPLMLRVVKEFEDEIQGLFRVVEHVREGATLPILKKIFAREPNLGHRLHSSIHPV